ncbi:MAG: AzlC family ABC transporter permease [Oscillospiraceae bacterium]
MKKTLRFAFIQTLPVLLGYSFIGIAFGLLLQRAGFGVLWAFFISLTVYAGSMQFVLVGILSGGMSLLSVIVMTLSINSRHIFYGLSFIERFKKMGGRRPYMIFSLTDETYSLLCSVKTPAELKEDDVFFAIALLNQLYWIIGSCAGSLLGELISFNSTGIEFAMTALFVVIFVEQWMSSKTHFAAVTGAVCGIVSLVIFGADDFLLPALISSVGILIACRRFAEKGGAVQAEGEAGK